MSPEYVLKRKHLLQTWHLIYKGNRLVLCSCSNENSLSSLGKRMTVQQEPSTDVRAVRCILDMSLFTVCKKGVV